MDPIATAFETLNSHPDFRVLRRFAPVDCYRQPQGATRTMMVIDTETTGLSAAQDKIIEIGFVLARFDAATGDICDVIERYSGLEDPGFPLSEAIKEITGISDADLVGQHFDDDRIRAAIAKADLVVAHNAQFDRGFLDLRFPDFTGKWWACSIKDAPWTEMRTGSAKLEFLATQCGVFYDAHRALVDAEVLLHVLTVEAHDGNSVSSHLIARARKPSYRVWAIDSPYDRKDDLKGAGYRWADGNDPALPRKAWYKDGVLELDDELKFLGGIYGTAKEVVVEAMTGRERYSSRAGVISNRAVLVSA
ncbi:MAG: 3'-5' exonuclease [Rhodocyclaceae bacterium]|nr:3'-5' exonuclease [Rhodocyclaceae bacterium]